MNSPRITVLLPVYNSGKFLQQALDSILAQTFTDLELLAIDDGSTDDSLAILRRCEDPRIRVVAHEQNQGLIATLNEGLEMARGAYIARMDNDDVMLPERLAKQMDFLDADQDIAVVACFVDFVNVDGETCGSWDVDRATANEDQIAKMLPRTNCIAHPTVMIRREALGDLRYDPQQRGAEDWDLWLRMRARGLRIAKLPEALLLYRQHSGSIMGMAKQEVLYERRLLRSRWRFLRGEWLRGRCNAVHLAVLKAQIRTLARHLSRNVLPSYLRSAKRILSYSPLALWREHKALQRAGSSWRGNLVCCLPYLNTGGAEQVHADILATVQDQHPLVVICGFSTDRAFERTYRERGTMLELPHLLNHPLTKRSANARLARLIDAQDKPVLFSSLTSTFFELLPLIAAEVPAYYLQHAFLYQPTGNLQHKRWLRYFERINGYIFISGRSKEEFEKFLFANHVPRSRFGKLHFISNAVRSFGSVRSHPSIGLLFVGRHSPEKRLDLFLTLCDELEKAHPGRFRFTVVGTSPIAGHEHVDFRGRVTDPDVMAGIYAAHDVLALTSEREGFPLVIMEAMAQGLVVLSTPVGDVPERLDPSYSIITSDPHGTTVLREMSEALISLDQDRDRSQAMKQAALSAARSAFDPDQFRERYRELLIDRTSDAQPTSPSRPAS